MKRGRPRNNQGRNPNQNRKPNPNRALESNGPGIKVRGAASTIFDKYTQLAHDAITSGDRIGAEYYYQYAEHYGRLVQAQVRERAKREEEQRAQREARQAEYDARKAARQAERNAETSSADPQAEPDPVTSEEPPKPAKTARNRKTDTTDESKAKESGLPEGMQMMKPTEPVAAEPAPAEPAPVVRRRVRRPRVKGSVSAENQES